MDKKRIIIFLAAVAGCSGAVAAPRAKVDSAYLRPLQERDSVLIADQLRYGFTLHDVEAGTTLEFPDFSGGICEGVEIVSGWQSDTTSVRGKKDKRLFDIDSWLVVTSFDEGTYRLPALAVARRRPSGETDTLRFDEKVLTVCTMPVDTATFKPHDIRGQIRYPVTFKELLPYFGLAAGVLLLAGLLVWWLRRRALARGDAALPDEPPYLRALRKLEHLRGNKYWAPEKQKFFYSSVTDTLREYIAARFGFGAMEMTTAEIFAALQKEDLPRDLYEEMKTLFETSDFVKFAKWTVSDTENARVIPDAVRFVTATWQEEPGQEPDENEKEG